MLTWRVDKSSPDATGEELDSFSRGSDLLVIELYYRSSSSGAIGVQKCSSGNRFIQIKNLAVIRTIRHILNRNIVRIIKIIFSDLWSC